MLTAAYEDFNYIIELILRLIVIIPKMNHNSDIIRCTSTCIVVGFFSTYSQDFRNSSNVEEVDFTACSAILL